MLLRHQLGYFAKTAWNGPEFFADLRMTECIKLLRSVQFDMRDIWLGECDGKELEVVVDFRGHTGGVSE